MKKLVFLCFCLISIGTTSLKAQNLKGLSLEYNRMINELHRINMGKPEYIKGEFYLSPEWKPGVMYMKNYKSRDPLQFRYFVYGDEIQIIAKGDTLALKGSVIDSVVFDHNQFIYTSYELGSKITQGYFVQLTNTTTKLLKRYTCEFVKGKKNVSSYEKPVPDQYKLRSSYFIQTSKELAFPLRVSKKEILKLFSDREDEISRYMKTNRIRLGREEDLVQLFQYYHQLQE